MASVFRPGLSASLWPTSSSVPFESRPSCGSSSLMYSLGGAGGGDRTWPRLIVRPWSSLSQQPGTGALQTASAQDPGGALKLRKLRRTRMAVTPPQQASRTREQIQQH